LNFLVYRRPVYLRNRNIDPTLSSFGAWRKALRFDFQNKTSAELERRSMTMTVTSTTVPGGQNANSKSSNNNNNDASKVSLPFPPTTSTRMAEAVINDDKQPPQEDDEAVGLSSLLLLVLGDNTSTGNSNTPELLSPQPTSIVKEEDTVHPQPLPSPPPQQPQLPIGTTEKEMDHNSTTNVEGRRYRTALKE
jgi:hypothetical protein